MQATVRRAGLLRLAVIFIISFALVSVSLSSAQEPNPKTTQKEGTVPPSASPSPTPSPLLEVIPTTPMTPEMIEQQKKAGEIEVLTTDTVEVVLTPTIIDNFDRHVHGLSKENFTVYEDGVKQEIRSFGSGDEPVDMGILFDLTGSMEGEKVQHAKNALRKFLETCNHKDQIFLMGIAEKLLLLQDFVTNDKDKIGAISDKLTFVQPKGQTPLYDAFKVAIVKLQNHDLKMTREGRPGRKMALLVISDGQDNASRYTFNDVKRELKESNIIIYSVVIPPSIGRDMVPDDIMGLNILTELAGITGGKAYLPDFERSQRFPDPSTVMNPRPYMSLEEAFVRIALELRHQYSISYTPTNKAKDGKWREIKVKVSSPKGYPRLAVRVKKGYYAPRV